MARFRKGTTDHDGDGKMGGSKKASPKPRKASQKPAVVKDAPERDPALEIVFEQGRTARRSGIARRDAPHGAGPQRDAWLEGWDFAQEHG